MAQTATIKIRRSISLLIIRVLAAELLFDFTYLFLRFLIDINILDLSDEIILIMHSFSIIIFVVLVTFIQTGVVIYILLDWANKYYEIRDKEIVFVSGVLTSQEKAYPFGNIQSVRIKQGFIGKLLNFGTVEVYIPILGYDLIFTEVSRPFSFAETIKKVSPDATIDSAKFLFRR